MIIELSNGKTINVPIDCDEVTFMQYMEFIHAENEYLDVSRQDDDEEGRKIDADQIEEYLIEAVGVMVTGDGFMTLPFSIAGDNMRVMMESKYIWQFGEDISVMRLYVHLLGMFDRYNDQIKERAERGEFKASEYVCMIGGKDYVLPSSRAVALFSDEAYTTGEVLELKYFRAKFQKTITERSDPTGQLAFNLGLSEMAILLRRDGEQLPHDKRHRTAFINRRAQLFKELPLSVIFDVRFFLISTLQNSLKNSTMQYILTVQAHQQHPTE